MANDILLNTTTDLNGKTVVTAEGDRSITGLLTYNRGASAPFACASGAANVTNLDADKVDGQHAPVGTIVGTSDSQVLTNKTLTAPVINGSISGSPAMFNKVVITAVGVQNDYAPGFVGNTLLLLNNATLLTIQGFAGGYDGQVIRLVSIGAGQIDLAHQNAGSTAANRLINFATSGNTSLAAGSGYAEYIYDGTNSRWRLIIHEQGAWITRTFAAGNYIGNAGTWTVAGGNVATDAYLLRGRTLTFAESLSASSSTTPGTQYRVLIPGGFSAAKETYAGAQVADNGVNVSALIEVVPAIDPTKIFILRSDLGNFTAGAGNVAVRGSLTFEIQ